MKKFKIWKTVTIDGTSLKKLSDRLVRAGCEVSFHLPGLFSSRVRRKETVDLVLVSFESICPYGKNGGKTGKGFFPSLEHLYPQARKYGLELCPAEVGLQLCLQHKNQLRREIRGEINMGTESVYDTEYQEDVMIRIEVIRNRVHVNCSNGSPGACWRGNERFVFIKPRK